MAVVLSLPVQLNAQQTIFLQDDNGLVVMEAENFGANTPKGGHE